MGLSVPLATTGQLLYLVRDGLITLLDSTHKWIHQLTVLLHHWQSYCVWSSPIEREGWLPCCSCQDCGGAGGTVRLHNVCNISHKKYIYMKRLTCMIKLHNIASARSEPSFNTRHRYCKGSLAAKVKFCIKLTYAYVRLVLLTQ